MRKLEERLGCVCVCYKECRQKHKLRGGLREGVRAVCACVCVLLNMPMQMQTACAVCEYACLQLHHSTVPFLNLTQSAALIHACTTVCVFVCACMYGCICACVTRIKGKKAPSSGHSPDPKQNQSHMWRSCTSVCVCVYVLREREASEEDGVCGREL